MIDSSFPPAYTTPSSGNTFGRLSYELCQETRGSNLCWPRNRFKLQILQRCRDAWDCLIIWGPQKFNVLIHDTEVLLPCFMGKSPTVQKPAVCTDLYGKSGPAGTRNRASQGLGLLQHASEGPCSPRPKSFLCKNCLSKQTPRRHLSVVTAKRGVLPFQPN